MKNYCILLLLLFTVTLAASEYESFDNITIEYQITDMQQSKSNSGIENYGYQWFNQCEQYNFLMTFEDNEQIEALYEALITDKSVINISYSAKRSQQ